MPRRYDASTKAKAVRLVHEHAGDYPTEYAATTLVDAQLRLRDISSRDGQGDRNRGRVARDSGGRLRVRRHAVQSAVAHSDMPACTRDEGGYAEVVRRDTRRTGGLPPAAHHPVRHR
jgi:hypothetical protein